MSTPRVSVVIPAYNQANFLGDAIQSVLAQTYHDYEIVVVNDGSTDRTDEVVSQYKEKIRYINQENQGLAGARNTGILASCGEYVALLDSDDIWDPSFLALMMGLVEKIPAATVYYCGVRYIDEKGNDLPQLGGLSVNPERELFHQVLRSNFIIPSTVVMKKQVIIEAGLFDIQFRRLQDFELWIRLLRNGHQFAALEGHYLVRYRVHEKNLSVDSAGGQQAARAAIEKNFGPDDGKRETWTDYKRLAYGGLYRYWLLSNVQRRSDWDQAVFIRKAILSDPGISTDIDLFYELALGSQPAGCRGTAQELNLKTNAENIEKLLSALFFLSAQADSLDPSLRDVVYGTAYKAIGLAAYNTGHLRLCRKYLNYALKQQPVRMGEQWILSTFLKTFLGNRVLSWFRRFRTQTIKKTEYEPKIITAVEHQL